MGAGVKADQHAKAAKAIAERAGRAHCHDMKILVLKGQEAALQEPEHPQAKDEKEKTIWSKKHDHYLKREQHCKGQKAKALAAVTGQCDDPLQSQVETASECEAALLRWAMTSSRC